MMKVPIAFVMPRLRWFAFGFALCGAAESLIDGYFNSGVLIMFIIGAYTYFPEMMNRHFAEKTRLFEEKMAFYRSLETNTPAANNETEAKP